MKAESMMNEIDALKKFEVILVSATFYMLNICWMLWNANKVQNTKHVFLKFMNVIVKIFKESRVRIGLLLNFNHVKLFKKEPPK